MPRTTKKTEATTASEGMSVILDTPVLKTVSEAANFVGCAEIRLLELFSDALKLPEALGWEVIPQEHEHLLNEFKAQASANTQVLPEAVQPPVEVAQMVSQAPSDPPVIEEEPKPAKHSKRKSSALTQKKTKAIEKGREATQQTQQGVKETLVRLQAQAGIKDAANAGTVYLQAFQGTLNQVKGQGLTVIAAEMIRDLTGDSDFNPDDILQDLGVSLSPDTQQALLEQLTPVLGKSQEATQEILETAWGNGIDLQAELSQLNSLMNYED